MALIEKLSAIGVAIREKTGKSDLLTLDQMPDEIASISGGGGGDGPTPEELTITGNCESRFAQGGWDWVINRYGRTITTRDITNGKYMFQSSQVSKIPFELNFASNSGINVSSLCFSSNITEAPVINGLKSPTDIDQMFGQCYYLRHMPDLDKIIDWGTTKIRNIAAFGNNYSLRTLPLAVCKHADPDSAYYYAFYGDLQNMHALDEMVDIPIPYIKAWTSNAMYGLGTYCSRLKRLTFETPNGQPVKVNWKSQEINLTQDCGYGNRNVTGYNSGITADKQVKTWVEDGVTKNNYQELKNDPDWFTWLMEYSRYNHDSAVETINSLPDASEYIAANGGTNTIKFDRTAGNKTDGGAIGTLTEEEIAVAAAKGWTVTFK